MNEWRTISLTNATATTVILALIALTFVIAASGLFKARRRKRTLMALGSALIVVAGAWLLVEKLWKPFPDATPLVIYAACVLPVWTLLSVFLQRGQRILFACLTVISLLTAGAVGNLIYQSYPTLGSFNPQPTNVAMTYEQFSQLTAPPTLPENPEQQVGALVTVSLDGTESGLTSGFDARDAYAYIPPAYWTHPEIQLPVIVLLAGNPGEPAQWFSSGDASTTADNYQATHDGISPIVISVDGTGSFAGNPACVDGPDLKVMTYLSQDVPTLIKENFRVNQNKSTWTIGGLSYGGTCAFQIATNYPTAYGSFLDFSGQAEPTLGTRADTVTKLFDGDESAFIAVNPADLLTSATSSGDKRYAHLSGKFIAGASDKEAMKALQNLNDLATQAGMSTSFDSVPGGHSFQVWRVALADSFEWAAQRGGLGAN
ncbi:alpha/beta hydrolase-fold protein [Corynebacterium callunae]|uniref:alpha/beta hydrolase n=1 Tax=Corynebacterium callunae TaxID=1721 RepID=UPI0039821B85